MAEKRTADQDRPSKKRAFKRTDINHLVYGVQLRQHEKFIVVNNAQWNHFLAVVDTATKAWDTEHVETPQRWCIEPRTPAKPRNELHITLQEYLGVTYLHIRDWYFKQNDDSEWFPTGRGVTFTKEEWLTILPILRAPDPCVSSLPYFVDGKCVHCQHTINIQDEPQNTTLQDEMHLDCKLYTTICQQLPDEVLAKFKDFGNVEINREKFIQQFPTPFLKQHAGFLLVCSTQKSYEIFVHFLKKFCC